MTELDAKGLNLALEAVRVTEAAALAASEWLGRGDEVAAEDAALAAAHFALNKLPIDGTIVIGEGTEEEIDHLFVGERIGTAPGGGPALDIAVEPLEGATITAKGGFNAVSVIAMAEPGGFLKTPPVYMEKIAVGPDLPDGVVDLDLGPEENLGRLAEAKGIGVADLVVCMLDRPRHAELISRVRHAGARIVLISDGDVSGVIATARANSGIDLYMGKGGAPEGVLAAAALYCMGGQLQGRLVCFNDDQRQAVQAAGLGDLKRKYVLSDLVHGSVMFAATGVTDGTMLRGIRRGGKRAHAHSLVMRSETGTIRVIQTDYCLDRHRYLPPDWQPPV